MRLTLCKCYMLPYPCLMFKGSGRGQLVHHFGRLTQHDAFVSTTRVFSWLMGRVPPYPARLRTFRRSRSTLTPLDCSCMPIWPLGPVPRLDTFVSSARSFPSPLVGSWVLWRSPGTTPSSSGALGSSRSLLGEFTPSACSERARLHSDALRSFFGRFLVFSTPPDGPDAFASTLVCSTPGGPFPRVG